MSDKPTEMPAEDQCNLSREARRKKLAEDIAVLVVRHLKYRGDADQSSRVRKNKESEQQ